MEPNKEKIILDENFGRISVALGLEDKLLKNGVLPERTIQERSAVVTGIVHGYLEKGHWQTAVDMIYKNGSVGLLYGGRKEELEGLIKSAIKPEDFDKENISGYTVNSIEMLIKKKHAKLVYEIALMKNMPVDASSNLLALTKKEVGVELWREGMSSIAMRVKDEQPIEAYSLFSRINDHEATNNLYQQLITNFSLSNFGFLKEVAEKDDWSRKVERLTSLVRAALNADYSKYKIEHGFGSRLGSDLYKIVSDNNIKLNVKHKKRMREFVAFHADYSDMDKIDDKNIQLLWAKRNCESNPETAYGIFLEQKYTGREVIPTAHRIFDRGYKDVNINWLRKGKRVEILTKHLEGIFNRVPKSKLDQRESLARKLGNISELRRIGLIKWNNKNYRHPEKAYKLLIESGIDINDLTLDQIRANLIEKELEEHKKSTLIFGPSFYWLDKRDRIGYERIYEALLNGVNGNSWPGKAYELSASKGDIERVTRAREAVLERNPANRTLRFFKDAKDKIGYEASLEKLSIEYNVPKEAIISMTGGIS
nr:hypothetical protein [Candidatus Woesearchaeota archaeon]